MKMIICKECGARIDADLGECPVCGMTYYTHGEKSKKVSDETRAFTPVAAPKRPAAAKKPASGVGSASAKKSAPGTAAAKGGAAAAGKGARAQRHMDDRTKLFIVAGVVLLAVLTVILSAMSGAFDFEKGEAVYMTDVTGKAAGAAKSEIERLGCEAAVTYEYSDEVPEGRVIRQLVKADKKLTAGETVGIVVSRGPNPEHNVPEPIEIPSFLGESYESAKQTLMVMGLQILRVAERYDETSPAGTIIEQDPAYGLTIEPGGTLRVVVSMGPEPDTEHDISVTAGKGGSVDPKGLVTVADGGSITFTITPDEGYELVELKIDGVNVGVVESYTFNDVTEDHSLYAVFRILPEQPSPSPEVSPEPSGPPESGENPGSPTDIPG